MAHWDTSALVKLYVQETDSALFDVLALAAPASTAAIALLEARTVFRRREAEGAIPAGEGTALYERLSMNVEIGEVRVQPRRMG